MNWFTVIHHRTIYTDVYKCYHTLPHSIAYRHHLSYGLATWPPSLSAWDELFFRHIISTTSNYPYTHMLNSAMAQRMQCGIYIYRVSSIKRWMGLLYTIYFHINSEYRYECFILCRTNMSITHKKAKVIFHLPRI